MWEEVARRIIEMGGEIHTDCRVERLITDGWQVKALETTSATGDRKTFEGDYFFSTAPVQEIMRSFDVAPPKNVLEVSDGLVYRDFITVGLLLRSLRINDETPQGKQLIRDNWIYIQEPDVQLGRLQIFNNWSPFMVADPAKVWLGLEYFCNESDEIWNLSDERMVALATGGTEQDRVSSTPPRCWTRRSCGWKRPTRLISAPTTGLPRFASMWTGMGTCS